MLEVIRKHAQGWPAKIILGVIVLLFALFGIDTYLREVGSNVSVVKVGSNTVSMQEFDNALQNYRNQIQQSQKNIDQAQLDSPEVKQAVLNRLVNSRLLSAEVARGKFSVSDDTLSNHITNMQEFQENGQFSQEAYNRILTQNRLTTSKFESSIKSDLLAQQVRDGLISLAYQPEKLTNNVIKAQQQQREVTVAELKLSGFADKVKLDEATIKAYYDKNKEKLKSAEQVKIEFVEISSNANIINGSAKVTEADAKQYFDENPSQFQGDEKRRASHILLAFGAAATPEKKAEIRKKAEGILAEVKKSPKQFDVLAKKYSEDPGSAVKGGDLGIFGRGTMVKPFEDAVFTMAPGAISDLVESEFGYHIIKLTEIKGAAPSFETAKFEIIRMLTEQKAQAKFLEQADGFTNMVYEQSNSLDVAAKTYNTHTTRTDWMNRDQLLKAFKSEKLVAQVFSGEAIKEHRNTEAIETAPNTLLSARVFEHKPAATLTFEEAKLGVQQFLIQEEAKKQAKLKGETLLAELKAGKVMSDDSIEWIPPVVVDRKNAQGLTDLTMNQVFKMDTQKLPAYAGVYDPKNGYLLIKVISVKDGNADDNQAVRDEIRNAYTNEIGLSYMNLLKSKNKVMINEKLLMQQNSP